MSQPRPKGTPAVSLIVLGIMGGAMNAVAGYVATSDSSTHLVVLAGFVPLAATWLGLARVLTDVPDAGRSLTADRADRPVPEPA